MWSLAFRRDRPTGTTEVQTLHRILRGDDLVITTGLILQELLQGFVHDRSRAQIMERSASVPIVAPDRDDHVAAADLRNTCHFVHAAPHGGLRVWMP